MGQTLSHGVYLPAEGERNCYSGLASNWNLLDTAIGDTAGKASATHTHGSITNDGKVGSTANKPLITTTDGAITTGSFGTTANTFCEGNDSRLSDARTPVAHTHTKSDITDLLNSNFIPSANNSYDLGSSSYQWNNLYANKVNTQSVNGINPGALSLPNIDSTQYDPIDFSQWNVSLGWGNTYTPQSDGWIHVNIKDSTACSVFVFTSIYAASAYGNGSQGLTGRVALMMPVRAGVTYTFMVKASSTSDIYSVRFFPCLGNV